MATDNTHHSDGVLKQQVVELQKRIQSLETESRILRESANNNAQVEHARREEIDQRMRAIGDFQAAWKKVSDFVNKPWK